MVGCCLEERVERILESQRLILEKLEDIERRVRSLEAGGREKRQVQGVGSLDVVDLLRLPDHLRSTMVTVIGLGDATADEIAAKTGRVRNLESSYLNQLVRLGHLEKVRKGRKIYFKPTYVRAGIAELVAKLRV